MPQTLLIQLVDDDLSPLLSRYRVLQRILSEKEEDPDVSILLEDVNVRFEALLDRLAT